MINHTLVKPLYGIDHRLKFINRLPRSATMLDIGCGQGDVIRKFISFRPDLQLHGIDVIDQTAFLPQNISFHIVDMQKERLPFPDNHFDAITCIQVLEHIDDLTNFYEEVKRVLKTNGILYLETPSARSMYVPKLNFIFPSKAGGPINFFDDTTHKRVWSKTTIITHLKSHNFHNIKSGVYRNFLYAISSPLLLLIGLLFRNRRYFVVGLHHLFGWSSYCIGTSKSNRE